MIAFRRARRDVVRLCTDDHESRIAIT